MSIFPSRRVDVLGVQVDCGTYESATQDVLDRAEKGKSCYVSICNVHMVMEAHDDPNYKEIVNRAMIVTPDGMPIVWALKLLGFRNASRVYGPTLTLKICQEAALRGIPVGFVGSTEPVLDSMRQKLGSHFPALRISCLLPLPFADVNEIEDDEVTEEINESGARILFVGLGCPKQERWMAAHVSKISGIMLGVGAAFDFIAGVKPQAPPWVQNAGFEWLFRLTTEPRRLWKRYLYNNPRFLLKITQQLLRPKFKSRL